VAGEMSRKRRFATRVFNLTFSMLYDLLIKQPIFQKILWFWSGVKRSRFLLNGSPTSEPFGHFQHPPPPKNEVF
jgi:hypothetical protein